MKERNRQDEQGTRTVARSILYRLIIPVFRAELGFRWGLLMVRYSGEEPGRSCSSCVRWVSAGNSYGTPNSSGNQVSGKDKSGAENPSDGFAIGLSLPMPSPAMWKRVIRRVLELVVTAALIVFVFSRPNTSAGLRYFIGSVAVLFLCLLLLRKWP